MTATLYNAPAPNVPYFVPHQYPPSGTAVDDGKEIPTLFQPITIRGVTFQNRLWVSSRMRLSCDFNLRSSLSLACAPLPVLVREWRHFTLAICSSLVFIYLDNLPTVAHIFPLGY